MRLYSANSVLLDERAHLDVLPSVYEPHELWVGAGGLVTAPAIASHLLRPQDAFEKQALVSGPLEEDHHLLMATGGPVSVVILQAIADVVGDTYVTVFERVGGTRAGEPVKVVLT